MEKISILMFAVIIGGSSNAIAHDGGPKVLKIKGLYLGMSIDDGARILRRFISKEFAKTYGEGEPLDVTKVPPFDKCNYGFGYFPPGCPRIFLQSDCSEERKVYYIYIHNDIADKMFDAKGLSQEEFVQIFENRHNIKMQFREKPNPSGSFPVRSWEFESVHGYKVTISQGHTIRIEEMARKDSCPE